MGLQRFRQREIVEKAAGKANALSVANALNANDEFAYELKAA